TPHLPSLYPLSLHDALRIFYKISVDQAIHGAPHVSDLMPCATVEVPNNRGSNPNRVTAVISFAADPVAPGSGDATVLLSFFSGGGGDALPSSLRVRGTVAISSPAGSPTCNVIGLVHLEPDDQPAPRGRGAHRGRPRRAGRGGVGAPAPVMRNAVARLAAARGWSDAQLAARAGVDRAHLNQVKNGRALPTVATALAIAHALGVP